MVVLQWHVVLNEDFHTLLRVTPEDQAAWTADKRFIRLKDKAGRHYITLGAGPEGGLLVSNLNRPADAAEHSAKNYITIDPPKVYADENTFIKKLLELDGYYMDDLDYDLFPAKKKEQVWWWADDGFNSNSFIAGLLAASGAEVPTPPVSTPGFDKPVPKEHFTNAAKPRKAGRRQ